MKIVDVSEFYSERGGGLRTYVQEKLRFAADSGHQVTVIAPGTEDRVEPQPGGKLVWVRSPPLPFDGTNYRMFSRSQPVHRIIDAEQPDLVEGSSPWRGGWIAARWKGTAPRAFFFHQDFVAAYAGTFLSPHMSMHTVDGLFSWYWRYLRRLNAHYDLTIAGGVWLRERLEQFGLRSCLAIPLGIEPGRFSPKHRDPHLRRELLKRCGAPETARLLLTVGRMHPEKQLGTIISGFSLAKSERPLGLVIVGDGISRRSIERRAMQAGNVHLAGRITDRAELARYFASADALLHGSMAETYGIAVAEAISSGLPVIAPDYGGAADLARHGQAQLYTAGSAPSCAAAIRAMFANETPPLTEDGASEIGTTDSHFRQLFARYEELVRERKARAGSIVTPAA